MIFNDQCECLNSCLKETKYIEGIHSVSQTSEWLSGQNYICTYNFYSLGSVTFIVQHIRPTNRL